MRIERHFPILLWSFQSNRLIAFTVMKLLNSKRSGTDPGAADRSLFSFAFSIANFGIACCLWIRAHKRPLIAVSLTLT